MASEESPESPGIHYTLFKVPEARDAASVEDKKPRYQFTSCVPPRTMEALVAALGAAVSAKDYRTAADLQDEIKALEAGGEKVCPVTGKSGDCEVQAGGKAELTAAEARRAGIAMRLQSPLYYGSYLKLDQLLQCQR